MVSRTSGGRKLIRFTNETIEKIQRLSADNWNAISDATISIMTRLGANVPISNVNRFLSNLGDAAFRYLSETEVVRFYTELSRLESAQITRFYSSFSSNPARAVQVASEIGTDNFIRIFRGHNDGVIAEARSLYLQTTRTNAQGSRITRNVSEITEEVRIRGMQNPYDLNRVIEDITLSQDAIFVRVHGSANPGGRWLVSIEDFRNFTSEADLVNRLALPNIPTEISIVRVPATNRVRRSTVGAQDGWNNTMPRQSGGAIQYEILDFDYETMIDWFQSMGDLINFLN
jgi:hypothetical protein